MVQVHLFISGFVQGVGYRQFLKSHARKLGLTGWVRHLDDGRVEVLAQGEKEKVEKLIVLCEKGSVISEVKDVSIVWEEPKNEFEMFEVI